MSKSQKFQKVIEFAVKNGYKPDGILGGVLEGKLGVGMDPNIYNHLVADRQYYVYIFDPKFAKALWGEKDNYEQNEIMKEIFVNKNWQHYLQQMVLEKDKIDYCYKFIKAK